MLRPFDIEPVDRGIGKDWESVVRFPKSVATRTAAGDMDATNDAAAERIALTLRAGAAFHVVPVASLAWLPTAHNAVASAPLMPGAMNDVGRHVAAVMLRDALDEAE